MRKSVIRSGYVSRAAVLGVAAIAVGTRHLWAPQVARSGHRLPAPTERSVRISSATFAAAGTGDVAWLRYSGTRRRKCEQQRTQASTSPGAPVLDPTWEGVEVRFLCSTPHASARPKRRAQLRVLLHGDSEAVSQPRVARCRLSPRGGARSRCIDRAADPAVKRLNAVGRLSLRCKTCFVVLWNSLHDAI